MLVGNDNQQKIEILKSLVWASGFLGGGLMGWANTLRLRLRSDSDATFHRRWPLLIPGTLLTLWSVERLVRGVAPEDDLLARAFQVTNAYEFPVVVAAIMLSVLVTYGGFLLASGVGLVPREEPPLK